MQIDDIINDLNRKPFFKILAFLVLSFPAYQNYGQMQSFLVAIITPNHTCISTSLNPNVSISKDQCSISVNGSFQKCTKWNFSSEPVGTTMMSDFSLVCEKSNYGNIFLIVWYLSSFTALTMGWLSDKYGRKKIVLVNVAVETISSLLLAFSPNVAINMVLRFCIGITSCSVYISFVWLMEMVNIKFRKYIGSFFWVYGCISYMIFPLIVYLTKNWRYTQIMSIVPSILYLFIFFIPESPRWLFVMGRKKEAFSSMERISKINNLKINFEILDIVVAEEEQKESFMVAVKSFVFMYFMALSLFLQFSVGILYSSVTVNVTVLSKNILLSLFLLGLMEAPGLFISYFCLHYLRRKVSLMIFGILGSILFWVSVFFSQIIYWQSILRIIIGCIAKAFVASVYQTSMVYVVELFPTSHRSIAFGLSQIFGFLSFIGAIYINKLSNIFFIIPMTIYLVLMILSCTLTFFFLPETKDLPVPETLEDQRELQINHEEDYRNYMRNKMKKVDCDSYIDDNINERNPLLKKSS